MLGHHSISEQPISTLADAAALGAFELNLEPGSYTIAGFAAELLIGRAINAESGVYTISGFAAELNKGFPLNAEPGVYSISGAAAELLATRALSLDPGAYVVTGQAAGLFPIILVAEPGSYVITGTAAKGCLCLDQFPAGGGGAGPAPQILND